MSWEREGEGERKESETEYGEMDARVEGIVKERLDLMSSYMYSFPHALIFSTCN